MRGRGREGVGGRFEWEKSQNGGKVRGSGERRERGRESERERVESKVRVRGEGVGIRMERNLTRMERK